ncbi:DUF4174 domain-containing protein [Maribacter sp. M208]|nr:MULTISPECIES: DUF4174 domain-containing protein [Maribacter]MDF4223479.1 DUF4174 domain-containing protein [Maribacter huludaoensis]
MNFLKTSFILFMMHSLHLQAQNISDFKWKNRIIVLYEHENNTAKVKNALQQINNSTNKLTERDLVVFIYKNGLLYTKENKETTIQNNNIVPYSYDGYMLIGKDGGIKFKSHYPFDIKQVFDLIDSMPMRRSEMKSKN